jgi:hypothetical protein
MGLPVTEGAAAESAGSGASTPASKRDADAHDDSAAARSLNRGAEHGARSCGHPHRSAWLPACGSALVGVDGEVLGGVR